MPESQHAARTHDRLASDAMLERRGGAGGTGERVAREPLTGRVGSERFQVVGSGPVGERATPTPGQDPPRYEEKRRSFDSPGASFSSGSSYWLSLKIAFALSPAALIAASGVAFPARTDVIMSLTTLRTSCCPRTFGSGELYWIRSNPCFPCGTLAQ